MSSPIVFFGSGPVAAESLRFLVGVFDLETVITKPATADEFKSIAAGIPVEAVSRRSELTDLIAARGYASQLGIIVDFGIIVDAAVIDHFAHGIINSHFSLLPRWRGADPISFSILEGDDMTGVSLIRIVPALDEGDILSTEQLRIGETETTPQLTGRLIGLSNRMLQRDIPRYLEGSLYPSPQTTHGVTYSRKLTKDESWLNWQKPAARLVREVRAFAGWPRSRCQINGEAVTITQAHAVPGTGQPGTFIPVGRGFGVCSSDGIFVIDELIPAGKKPMPAIAFLAGRPELLQK